jgi:hypothetical protein
MGQRDHGDGLSINASVRTKAVDRAARPTSVSWFPGASSRPTTDYIASFLKRSSTRHTGSITHRHRLEVRLFGCGVPIAGSFTAVAAATELCISR